MNKNRVNDIAGNFYKMLGHYSREMAVDFDEDSIHNFRVEYKKMRAFFRLANEVAPKGQMKIPKKLQEVYSLAGALRDQQLQLGRVSETAKATLIPLPDYYFVLGRELVETRSRLSLLLATTPGMISKKKNDCLLPGGFKLQSFSAYFQNKCADVRKILLASPVTDESLHKIRKILKGLYYNLEIYRQERKLPRGSWKEKVALYFSPLLDEMGDYQDKCTAVSLIALYWLQHLDTPDTRTVAVIREDWNTEKISLKQHLVKKLTTDPVLASGEPQDIPLILNTVL